MQTSKKNWKDLTPTQRGMVIGGAVVQLTLLALAQRDLVKRPAEEVRGPKWLWRIVTLINFVGPIAYFCFGRKKVAETEVTETPEPAVV